MSKKKPRFFQQKGRDCERPFYVLPEIVGKWYIRIPVADFQHMIPIAPTSNTTSRDHEDDDTDDSRLWCYCSKPGFADV